MRQFLICQVRASSTFVNSAKLLFQPVNVVPKGADLKKELNNPKCQRLMLDMGIISQSSPGIFHILPLGLRSLEKLENLIDRHMKGIGAQKLRLGALSKGELWVKSKRWTEMGDELFRLKDRHDRDLVLGPTFEEEITALISSYHGLSYRQLPLLLYQISEKYRDEMKPRCGLLRSRSFTMKDLYSFDIRRETAEYTYSKITEAYDSIFESIGLTFYRVAGDPGTMGGEFSHEYQIPSTIGEDSLRMCEGCGKVQREDFENQTTCSCGCNLTRNLKAIEVGHTFMLGTKYSDVLQAYCLDDQGHREALFMTCAGIGLTRLLAAGVQSLSTEDSLIWPKGLAPFTYVILPAKKGSKYEAQSMELAALMYSSLNNAFPDDVLLDDRTQLTIGKRALAANRLGIPCKIVLGASLPAVEVIYEEESLLLQPNEVVEYLKTLTDSTRSSIDATRRVVK